MTVRTLEGEDRAQWNSFVAENFPPVGAFLQSYEWGEFKEAIHDEGARIVVEDAGEWIACFHMELHKLPFRLSYGYAPRGPVLRKDVQRDTDRLQEVFMEIASFLKTEFPQLSFVRLEPSYPDAVACFDAAPFAQPPYYLQPRFNQLVTLHESEELLATFSSDVKHDIRAAERLGITVTESVDLTPEQSAAFEAMKRDTRIRSHKGIFPSDEYFALMEKKFKRDATTKQEPHTRYFIASNKEGVPVAMNMNILFGSTLTYLYGASYTGSISKRAPAYLHWKTMEYAVQNGFTHYDLGGVDDALWHGLTYFKRQFGGEVYTYMGIVDVVLKPSLYKLYNQIKGSS